MRNSIAFTGQWIGYFSYGPEYGNDLVGEKVQFRIFVDSFNNEEFTGRSVDLEGIGANYEIAQAKGYIDDDFISFTKQYPHLYGLDEAGNTVEDKTKQHPIVSYSGIYNAATKTFTGQWELRVKIAPVGEYWRRTFAQAHGKSEKTINTALNMCVFCHCGYMTTVIL